VKRLLLTTVCSVALAWGCGSNEHDLPGGGSSAYAFEVSPGVTVTTATYRVSGPGGFTSAGQVAVGDAADVSIPLSGLPVGVGYQLDLNATASDGVTECMGSSAFDVPSTAPVTVSVHLFCGVPSGDVSVTATTNICTMIDTFDVLPAETRIGGRISLSAVAHDSDDGPSAITYKWRTNGRLLNGLTQPNFTFTCTSVGNVTIAVSASDGKCEDSLSATITCSSWSTP
jgi:hypothetical protein